MSLRELLAAAYQWAEAQALLIFLGAVIWAAAGTLLARLGKAGRSDRDGRLIASVVIGGAVALLVLAVLVGALAHGVFHKSVFDGHVLLVLAPLVCLAGSVLGIRWVFPLNELATVQTLRDIGVFLLACAGGLWLLSTFRGWGLMFIGSLGEMLVIGTLGIALLRTLYRRAAGKP